MAILWLLLAAVRIPVHAFRGLLTSRLMLTAALSVPFIIVGIVVGYLVHLRLRKKDFKRVVGIALVVAGGLVLLPEL